MCPVLGECAGRGGKRSGGKRRSRRKIGGTRVQPEESVDPEESLLEFDGVVFKHRSRLVVDDAVVARPRRGGRDLPKQFTFTMFCGWSRLELEAKLELRWYA